ncbi:MAG: hypothetical protein AAFY72_15770 [Cyanobacteria bacterium J06649_4]
MTMTMTLAKRLANPFYYPLAMLAGGVVLVAGARLVRLPAVVMVPVSGAIALTTATALKSREPDTIALDNPALSKELQRIRSQAVSLTETAQRLKEEANKLLTSVEYIDLLGTVQYVCDRTQEMPAKIDQLARRLQGKDALLSMSDMAAQQKEATAKIAASSGLAKEKWQSLSAQLANNIALVKQGEDAREAQLIQLRSVIVESGGVLQQLQNKLRTADLDSAMDAAELKAMSDELKAFQENADVLLV